MRARSKRGHAAGSGASIGRIVGVTPRRGAPKWNSGLVRFGARDYDASVGRWTAKDSIGFSGLQANVYVYVGNDPVNGVDPTGKWGFALGYGGGIAGGAGIGGFPWGGFRGSTGFWVGTEGFGTYSTLEYTNGIGGYAGHGAEFSVIGDVDNFRGTAVGGAFEIGDGVGFGVAASATPSGEFASASISGSAQAGLYAGGTVGYTGVWNTYAWLKEKALDFMDQSAAIRKKLDAIKGAIESY